MARVSVSWCIWATWTQAESRLGVQEVADKKSGNDQRPLFDPVNPRWVQVDVNGIRVERPRDFGAPWLGLELLKKLDLTPVLEKVMPRGHEQIPWSTMALVLVLCRLCDPSSELYITELAYRSRALIEWLGIPQDKCG